jgi:hypothetical protein
LGPEYKPSPAGLAEMGLTTSVERTLSVRREGKEERFSDLSVRGWQLTSYILGEVIFIS